MTAPEQDGSDEGREDEPRRDEPAGNPFQGTPLEALFGSMTGGAPQGSGGGFDLAAMFGQLQRLVSAEGPVNWDLAREVARQRVSAAGDPWPTEAERAAVVDAVRLAEHWLDTATALPTGAAAAQTWSRAEWVEGTLPVWRRVIEPVARHVVDALGRALPAEARQAAGPLLGMLTQAGGAVFGSQVGQAIGQLAGEVVGAADVGLPLGPANRAVLLPANVTAFGEGLGIDADDVRLYLALRECAHQRLFAHAPWLANHLLTAVEDYGRGMEVDLSRIESAISGLDPTDPEGMQRALSGGLFEPAPTPAQEAALRRLETALALVEGWVDEVVGQATENRMPNAARLREAVRRRRATGGPAEQAFATLVGLELRPRRLRDAAALWGALRSARGREARDAVWAHPDLLPDAADLDDPLGFPDRAGPAQLDLGDL